MSKKINHWCVICGTGYHACDSCNEIKSFTPWRALTDTIEHYEIFMILKEYQGGLISKSKARALLADADISNMATFKESAKKILEEILKEEVPVKFPKKKQVAPAQDDETFGADEPINEVAQVEE